MGAQERKILILYILLGVFLAALLIYFFVILFRRQKKLKQLETEKLNAEIKAIAHERNTIAAELHNDLAPQLAAVKMRLHLLPVTDSAAMEACSEVLSECIQQIRNMTRSLSPISLYDLSFQAAIQKYIEDHKGKHSLQVQWIENDCIELTTEQHNQVYRIVQEMIYNAIKHSKGTRMTIEISKENDRMLIRTADDGVGFDFDVIKQTHQLGYGLLGIQSRVDYLQGTLSMQSTRSGTCYNIRIPL